MSMEAPTIVTFQDVSAASFRIVHTIQKTPCLLSHLSEMFQMNLYLKMEQMQVSCSMHMNIVVHLGLIAAESWCREFLAVSLKLN